MGGVSGPAIRPIAVRCVYELARAVDVPIIGTGGVSSGRDALEMIMAGATLVGVGSAVYGAGRRSLRTIRDEMLDWMTAHEMDSLHEIRGIAHASPITPQPTRPDLPQAYTIAEVRVENPTIRTFVLDGDDRGRAGPVCDGLAARAGRKAL